MFECKKARVAEMARHMIANHDYMGSSPFSRSKFRCNMIFVEEYKNIIDDGRFYVAKATIIKKMTTGMTKEMALKNLRQVIRDENNGRLYRRGSGHDCKSCA